MSDAQATIRELVTTNKVTLFMKGSRSFPQCGFSAQVVELLNKLVPTYTTVNVLSDPEIREGIKKFSDWPTIPQLYIDGKFVGGCDIVKEMAANGELKATLEGAGVALHAAPAAAPDAKTARAPSLTISDRAAKALLAAKEGPDDQLRMVISAAFENELFFDGKEEGDVVVNAGGIAVRLDPASAGRADGVTIDFVDTAGGAGFKIDNPNAPPRAASVRSMTPKGLRAALDAKEPLLLFDVRTDGERATASVKEALPLDDAGVRKLSELPKSQKLVFMCHHGMRSRVAAESALRQGFTDVWNLEGGIEAWSTAVDTTGPRY
jgi:monothiol glutaredoxin